jgi:GDP-L-fucose synthase
MAGLVGGINANMQRPADFFYDNLTMSAHLLYYAHDYGIKKAILVSAGCGYPEHASIPTKEEDYWNGLPQAESAPYSLAKRMQIVQAKAVYTQYGLPSVVVIPGNLYGAYDWFNLDQGHVIPALVRRFVEAVDNNAEELSLWGHGTATRDFVYAPDVCEGILKAAETYDEPQIVNLSSGKEHSIAEVVKMLQKITGFKGRITWDHTMPDGQARRCFDVSKAKRDMGFEARTSLYHGLKLTVDWYRKNQGVARK